ncbi:hypothetical protein GE061_010858 [Apolygus lucorum]|uniref:G-protein coupled receptors family 1 profile domain-containing protein n=1 Tax=Apolygus lucorum TaxID=248454 RepID=A0A8S9XW50_APOLU|nr:hypothetical protein GE061_010858 [Apolygus lucorum]
MPTRDQIMRKILLSSVCVDNKSQGINDRIRDQPGKCYELQSRLSVEEKNVGHQMLDVQTMAHPPVERLSTNVGCQRENRFAKEMFMKYPFMLLPRKDDKQERSDELVGITMYRSQYRNPEEVIEELERGQLARTNMVEWKRDYGPIRLPDRQYRAGSKINFTQGEWGPRRIAAQRQNDEALYLRKKEPKFYPWTSEYRANIESLAKIIIEKDIFRKEKGCHPSNVERPIPVPPSVLQVHSTRSEPDSPRPSHRSRAHHILANELWTTLPTGNGAASSLGGERKMSTTTDPYGVVVIVTVIYSLIFLTGVIGNVSTCVVIARNRHMHTATNYYLFSLAISDLLLLVSGLPNEIYNLWINTYVFSEAFCILIGFTAEACANATVLTITAFTVERYVAICHPFLSHTVSKLSRAVKFIVFIWLAATLLAIPQASQFGIVTFQDVDKNSTVVRATNFCTYNYPNSWMEHAFVISTCLFFIIPMSLITVLYVLIGRKLRRSKQIKRPSFTVEPLRSQNHVIKMLIAVVVAFFICWAPFHAQRLLAVYANYDTENSKRPTFIYIYQALTHVSGVLYYFSTTVNPLLYNIMSYKFREAFKGTLARMCGRGNKISTPCRNYSVLSRGLKATNELVRQDTLTDGRRLRLAKQPATISNSSLQDVDETEYTGVELACYMGELNTS